MSRSTYSFRSLAILAVAGLLAGCPEPGFPANVAVFPDIVYARGWVSRTPISPVGGQQYALRDLPLDVFQPTDRPGEPKPALLVIHGGGFVAGSRHDPDVRRYAAGVAEAGYVCFLIDYRLGTDGPPAPDAWGYDDYVAAIHAAAVDASAALRFIFAHADAYEVDPARVAVMGGSAGAVTALNVALFGPEAFPDDGENYRVPGGNNDGVTTPIRAVVDFWGSGAYCLGEIDGNDPPVLMVHGQLDRMPTVSYSDALVLKRGLDFRGVPCEFHTIRGAGHAPWGAEVDGQNLSALTVDFLDRWVAPAAD